MLKFFGLLLSVVLRQTHGALKAAKFDVADIRSDAFLDFSFLGGEGASCLKGCGRPGVCPRCGERSACCSPSLDAKDPKECHLALRFKNISLMRHQCVTLFDNRFLVDSAVFASLDSDGSTDVTDIINELIAAHGTGNLTGGRPLHERLPDPALYHPKVLKLMKNDHHMEILEKVSEESPVFDVRELFSDVLGASELVSFNDEHVAVQQPLRVDHAVFRSMDDERIAKDVTFEVNRLLAVNGLTNFTGRANLSTLFGDIAEGHPKSLRLMRGARFLSVPEDEVDNVYDLRPLFSESLFVDSAQYIAIQHPELSIDVTNKVNRLLAMHGAENITQARALSRLFGDPAPGEGKMLHVKKGERELELRDPSHGGPSDMVYNLMPLFLTSGAVRPKKTSRKFQPSVYVAVFSRRSSMLRRNHVRDMWQRAVGSSGNVTVKFALCAAADNWQKPLELEARLHGDILLLDCEEGYGEGRLTRKVLEAMWAYRFSTPVRDLFMKVDDDTFVAWSQFAELLGTRSHSHAYMGIPIGQGRPCRDPNYLWFEPYETFSDPTFPEAMAGGSGYVLGHELVAQVLDTGIAQGNVLWNEDRAVGVWMHKLQQLSVRVEYIAVPGIDGWWNWDYSRPMRNWEYWADYPHLVHHGLQGETIACLAQADLLADPWRPINVCFQAEVGMVHQPLSCTEGSSPTPTPSAAI